VTAFSEFVPNFDHHQRWLGRRLRPELRVGTCPSDGIVDQGGNIWGSSAVPHQVPGTRLGLVPRTRIPIVIDQKTLPRILVGVYNHNGVEVSLMGER
jgi:hypothetical protein